ncbi:dihydroorotase [Hydrogenispora ethanolica]|jgi:dihydroorotase|uniref:Dihydroorotase n=1 Tax=Hydrogenispora ethanolica TaxID=1082276 RepID=A0A4R1QWR4_HYDET|nr:dihydroorotase [Hydrogenispora ethanolica]TCL54870.1 dihydroorotase [Hydrogenispora ethanolica]
MKYCIKGGEIVNPAGEYSGVGDLLLDAGQVVAVGQELPVEDAVIIQAEGKMVLPGLIDMHCHLREPGREDEETIASGTRAAVKGGFTAVACMANTNPVADGAVVIEYVLSKARQNGWAKVYPIGAITKGLKGEELAEMGEMAEAGAVAFSDDGKTLTNPAVLRSALEYAALFDRPLLLHEEEPKLADAGVMHEGYWSTVLGLPGIPALAEDVMIARDLLIAEYTGGKVHFCHLSTAKGVGMLAEAKRRGLNVSGEATPHHFTLTDQALENYDTAFRVSPPLRSEEHREALRRGLQDGTIQVIATDHAPHSLEEKHREFALAPTGMIGLETAFSVAWTELVLGGWLTKEQLVEKLSVNPARLLNLPAGRLQPGDLADLIIVDPEWEWVVKPEEIASKSKNSPFIGRKLKARVETVWVNGILKYDGQKFVE